MLSKKLLFNQYVIVKRYLFMNTLSFENAFKMWLISYDNNVLIRKNRIGKATCFFVLNKTFIYNIVCVRYNNEINLYCYYKTLLHNILGIVGEE
jgi:hypothetical protein